MFERDNTNKQWDKFNLNMSQASDIGNEVSVCGVWFHYRTPNEICLSYETIPLVNVDSEQRNVSDIMFIQFLLNVAHDRSCSGNCHAPLALTCTSCVQEITRYVIDTRDQHMGLDGTLTSHIERVANEFDMACQSAI